MRALFLLQLFLHTTLLGRDCSSDLEWRYQQECRGVSDIHEHVPVLRGLASECSSVVEIGLRDMRSTWGILRGLVDSRSLNPSYLGIDINQPGEVLSQASDCAQAHGIVFAFWHTDDLKIDIPEGVDLLFIDSLHTYCHLTYELEKFSPKVRKYIAMHDTSPPWGYRDQEDYHGNYTEYPRHISRAYRGLWPAVQNFLVKHPEWILKERRMNNYGFTILERICF